jgi:hypothetical protein
VFEDAVGGTAGDPLPFVTLDASPAMPGLAVTTDADGKFQATLPCSGEPYVVSAVKQGYEARQVTIVPNQDVVKAVFTLERATGGFRFLPIAAVDYATHATLVGVRIEVDGAGDAKAYFTGAAGLATVPVPRMAAATPLRFSKQGYHAVEGLYSEEDPTWTPGSGVGRVVASKEGVTVKLVNEATASIPDPCVDDEARCFDKHAAEVCVGGDWEKQLKCSGDTPWCNDGVCGACSNEARTCIDSHTISACQDGYPIEIFCGEQMCVNGQCQ